MGEVVMPGDGEARTEIELAYRALALAAVCYRASTDQAARRGVDPERERKLDRIRAWAAEQGVDAHFSDFENDAMDAPLGGIDDGELFGLGWRLQALVAALWTIGVVDPMPTYERSVAAAAVQAHLPLGKPIDRFLHDARIRTDREIRDERTRAQFWTWRARCESMRRGGAKPPAGQTYAATIAEAARSAHADGLVPALADGDVACLGRPYHQLADAEFTDAASTAVERLYLLNWACGMGDDWDVVPVDT